MTSDETCPADAELLGLLTGELDEPVAARLEGHLVRCHACRDALEAREMVDLRAALTVRGEAIPRSPGALPQVSGYELEVELARGGQGVVYRALQLATRRRVALKLLLGGSHASLRQQLRFEREVELAAGLRHPHIVTVFESGTAEGCPYYTMELIDGVPLDRYARERGIGRDERLALFVAVCSAVSHAHQRGVVHRDLKPGNVLVDPAGHPHVLDFGLAKTAHEDLARSGLTAGGEFLGTLAYAAPEQVGGDPGAIGLGCDVYALGVIVYELLVGRLPYAGDGPIATVLQHIVHTAPAAPNPPLPIDLWTIVTKALAKEPERRYPNAAALREDLQRYQNGQPIDARRDSALYVLRLLLRRHTIAVAFASALAGVVVAALVFVTAAWREAERDRDAARVAERAADEARAVEAAWRANAERDAARAGIAAAAAAVRGYAVGDAAAHLDRIPASRRGWEWHHLHGELDHALFTLPSDTEYVKAVAYHPGGQCLAAGCWDGRVVIWELDGDRLIDRRVLEAGGPVYALCYHPDGSLAIGTGKGELLLWPHRAAAPRLRLQGPTVPITGIAFGGDGAWVAVACGHAGVHRWATDGTPLSSPPSGGDFVSMVATSGELLVGAGWGIKLWRDVDLAPEALLARHVSCIALAASPDHIAAGIQGAAHAGLVRLWPRSGRRTRSGIELIGHPHQVLGLAFRADGRELASVSRDGTLRRWSVDGRLLATHVGHRWAVQGVAWNGTGTRLATGAWDGIVRVWDAARVPGPRLLAGHVDRVIALAAAPRMPQLASGSLDGTIKIWDLDRGAELASFRAHEGAARGVAWSPDGTRLASAGADGTVGIWTSLGQSLFTLRGHEDRVHGVAWSPDGRRLVSGSADNTLRVWDATTGEALAILTGHDDHIHAVAFSPCGRWLASAGHTSLRIWDGAGLAPLGVFERTMVQDDYSLAFHPRLPLVIAGADRNSIGCWNLARMEQVATWRAHNDEIHAVAFSPDGTRIVSAAYDRRVRVWDSDERQLLLDLGGTGGQPIEGVAWSAGGRHIATGLADGTIAVWSAVPEGTR